ncbi:pneumococcal serine-rich repeat protein isoform X1 [Clupea harengus]|uniref:Pneumococcal serine-rich repeat protein isoform X1 n=1 Tax=Clupea harengus TaxID=7950 RepID=A0A6P3VP27_CLUHA|nr:pneumococcal serine-rich repeat protein isoform X1 [Clupea harengus]
MAENVRSPFDYREPPTLDSDGDGSKPPPPRGRVCGRKRKGTPVKVCDRAYVTEDEEESMSEHSYSPGDGQYPEGAEDRLPPPGSPYYLADPSQLCVPELGEEGAGGVRGPVLFHPPPNCRIREVHCGSQVRLVVIAIRDIAKGEEITVDYSLTDWGDNTMSFHSSVSPRGFECSFNPENNIKKEEESGPMPLSLTVSDYLTPSWSLSPSSSPLSHSEASDSDREDEEDEEEEDEDEDEEEEDDLEELRGRMMRRRKKRKTSASVATAAATATATNAAAAASTSSSPVPKKKASAGRPPGPHRGPSLAFSRSASSSASPSKASTTAFQAPLAPPPTTNINNNININIGHRGSLGSAPRRQHCVYCGRNFRSLARHLEKYHAQQPEVRAAMELAHMRSHSTTTGGPHSSSAAPSSSSSAAAHSTFASPQPSSSSSATAPASLFSRENAQGPGAVSFSLSLSQPSRKTPAAPLAQNRKGTVTMAPLNTQPGKSPPVAAATASAAAAVRPPAKRGRRPKKEKEEQLKQEELERAKEEAPPTPGRGEEEEEEEAHHEEEEEEEEGDGEAELSDGREEESLDGKNGEMTRSHRTHMPPLLSSLSCLVLYLRRQQHSAFLSLSRSPGSAEAWRLLCHSSLALLILYNRHRECEVAKLTIQEYRNRFTPPPPPMSSSATGSTATNGASSNGTGAGGSTSSGPAAAHPLEVSLSPFERHVLCHLPRAGVVGKRGRMQPLILPPHSEACLELLLSTCAQVGVDPQSPYVFSRPYHSPATPLRGTDLLRGLARSSGAKNPAALTAPRARRQVAILTQLLLLEEGERKRLEDFLQREYHVTQSCARIGQDPGLMGRVGRVVLYGERDGVLFRGMSLQQICLELDVMSGNSADSFSDDSDVDAEKGKERPEVVKKGAGGGSAAAKKKGGGSQSAAVTPAGHKRRSAQPKSGKRGVLKRPWSEAERVAVETHLKRNIMELRVPAKADCERCLQLCPLLVTNQRDWRAIKFYCHNRIQLLKKQGRREANGAAVC